MNFSFNVWICKITQILFLKRTRIVHEQMSSSEMSPWSRPHPLQLTSKCVHAHLCVCVLKSIQIKPGWRQPCQAEDKPWREWISSESVRLIWPARSEIQQLCLDMMNCMCRTRVFTEQTTERQKEKKSMERRAQERNPALSHKHLVKERNHKEPLCCRAFRAEV